MYINSLFKYGFNTVQERIIVLENIACRARDDEITACNNAGVIAQSACATAMAIATGACAAAGPFYLACVGVAAGVYATCAATAGIAATVRERGLLHHYYGRAKAMS